MAGGRAEERPAAAGQPAGVGGDPQARPGAAAVPLVNPTAG